MHSLWPNKWSGEDSEGHSLLSGVPHLKGVANLIPLHPEVSPSIRRWYIVYTAALTGEAGVVTSFFLLIDNDHLQTSLSL